MLWVLKRTISMRPKTDVKPDWKENIYTFTLQFHVDLNLLKYRFQFIWPKN